MSALVKFAETELRRAGLYEKDSDYDGAIAPDIVKLIKVFATQGDSGASAALKLNILEKLLRFRPLTPLTGADDEWMCVSEMSGCPMWQNTRRSSVFKDGITAWDIDAPGNRVPIAFPYEG